MNRDNTLDSIHVSASDPDDPSKEPSEMVTITFTHKSQTYHLSIHTPESVDDFVNALEDAKQNAWNAPRETTKTD